MSDWAETNTQFEPRRPRSTFEGEGDAAACTICARIVSAWLPGCTEQETSESPEVRDPSLCQALGVSSELQPPDIVFPEWLNPFGGECIAQTKLQLAINYCSGMIEATHSCTEEWHLVGHREEVRGYPEAWWVRETVIEPDSNCERGFLYGSVDRVSRSHRSPRREH
ncbi:MAG TPA: hypothetical protein VI072_02425 [Polyangiaceae bacterium]